MRLIAAIKVTQPARGPHLVDAPLRDEHLEHLVLARSLDRHQVHADLPAQVAGVQPAGLMALKT